MEPRPPMENDANAATAEELEQQAADVYVERAAWPGVPHGV